MTTLRLATRRSLLALAQARAYAASLRDLDPELHIEEVQIVTSGDKFQDRPLQALGGKGLFIKEIEAALLSGEIDCAVHSMKDLPAELAPGLVLAAVPEREDPRDAVLTRAGEGLAGVPAGARVGTSSLRRAALVRAARPDVEVVGLRGNVDTRLRKLAEGEVAAILLARAGLRRLGVNYPHVELCAPESFIPAIGQGALALESRADGARELLRAIEHPASRQACDAERAFLFGVQGSCVTPLGAHATVDDGALTLRAFIAAPDGSQVIRGETRGAPERGSQLGADLARELLGRGGAEILSALEAS